MPGVALTQGTNPQANPRLGVLLWQAHPALRGAAVHPGSRPAPQSPDTSGILWADHRPVERQVLLSTALARAL
jgi:hypothetical protein